MLQSVENILSVDPQIFAVVHHVDSRRQTGEVRVHVALSAAQTQVAAHSAAIHVVGHVMM